MSHYGFSVCLVYSKAFKTIKNKIKIPDSYLSRRPLSCDCSCRRILSRFICLALSFSIMVVAHQSISTAFDWSGLVSVTHTHTVSSLGGWIDTGVGSMIFCNSVTKGKRGGCAYETGNENKYVCVPISTSRWLLLFYSELKIFDVL